MSLSLRLIFLALLGGLTFLLLSVAQTAAPDAPQLGAGPLKSPPLAKKIVLIGGKKSHGPGVHDFPNGIPMIASWLRAAPAFADADVLTYTAGWPPDSSVLEGASTIVLYFDGLQERPMPLLDSDRIARLQKLMDQGTGLIALHQASTLPRGNTTVPLVEWLGARRDGMVDRTFETVTLAPATADHPVAAGIGEFTINDEFYPTLIFSERPVVPILRAAVTPKFSDPEKQAAEPPDKGEHVLAWAYERPNGGRSFGYTGGHFLKVFDDPQLRKLLVNAIAWTAHIEVPAPPIVSVATVNRHDDNKTSGMPWGELRWFTSAELKNSRTMTTGVAIIRPGQSNPVHLHPNCDEILHVVSGKILHTMNEVSVEMNAGDTVSIPQGVLHNATNIGNEDAVLSIAFSSAFREAVGY